MRELEQYIAYIFVAHHHQSHQKLPMALRAKVDKSVDDSTLTYLYACDYFLTFIKLQGLYELFNQPQGIITITTVITTV